MATIQEMVPPPPRPPHPAWSRRVNRRFMKYIMGSALMAVVAAGLISLQFLGGSDTPIFSRIAIGIFTFPLLVMAWLLWRMASKEKSEATEAWSNWNLSGMKSEGGAPKPVEPSAVDLHEVLAGRTQDQYFVLIDPKYRFNRLTLEPDLLQELSEKPSER